MSFEHRAVLAISRILLLGRPICFILYSLMSSMPIERAVPRTIFVAISRSAAFISCIFSSAILRACASGDFGNFIAVWNSRSLCNACCFFQQLGNRRLFCNKGKGFILVHSNDGGRISPPIACVFALNSLQKAMIFTPAAPKAGPIGGAGLAFPAGICNLMILTTFFDIVLYYLLKNFDEASNYLFTSHSFFNEAYTRMTIKFFTHLLLVIYSTLFMLSASSLISSTWTNSRSSTRVSRPKMETMTLNRPLSWKTSVTVQ